MTRLLLLSVLIVSVWFVAPSFATGNGYHLKIYYDDLDVIYRTGGTMENIVERADYIIEVIDPRILIKIPGPTTYMSTEGMSLDLRIRCDLTTSSGETSSYGFDNAGDHMMIGKKIYSVDRILLKEIVKHLPISQADKVKLHYGL